MSNPYTTINHDAFARQSIIRRPWYSWSHQPGGCAFCGSFRETKTGRKYLYNYGTESDAGRVSWQGKLFCSVGCMRAYNG